MNGHAQSETRFDVVIVGAGISGVNAAYRLQDELPGYSYTILEARDDLGGTWDLFKYPGIRSDSDLFTFGFSFNPWSSSNPIADGKLIKNYIGDTAKKYGIDKNILYRHRLSAANWSSEDNYWSLNVDHDGTAKTINARFILFGSGYYNYHEPLQTTIPGIENFQGQIIHPQFWPEDLDYAGKKVVIIGSGATAITLLPNLAAKAERVTMVQRSPTYILSLPNRGGNWLLRWILPTKTYHNLLRQIWIIQTRIFFLFCQGFPNPRYNPWDQRLCVSPDGDFYASLRSGKGDIRTDTIKTVTKKGLTLSSGATLDADIIVTATGLKLQIAGGASLSVNGKKIDPGSKYMWHGVMLQDLPNASFIIGYTNASWTLGSDATAQFVVCMIKSLEARKLVAATPRVKAEDITALQQRPLMKLSSTYISASSNVLPRAADRGPWQPRDHYFKDVKFAVKGDFDDSMEYVQGPSVHLRAKVA
ncbi:hypothetical protein N7454_007971 [Penicillium verhagenii]|nr:hypothetical protein N7454_007971 [Penicillium verhagenii]